MKVLDKPTDALFHRFVSGETYEVSFSRHTKKGFDIFIEGDCPEVETHDDFLIPYYAPDALFEVFTHKPKTKNFIKAEIRDRGFFVEAYLVPVEKRWKWG